MSSSSVVLIDSAQEIAGDYDLYLIDGTSSNFTVTLPVITYDGLSLSLKRTESTLFRTITIAAGSGNSIDNSASKALGALDAIYIVSYGTDWYIVSQN